MSHHHGITAGIDLGDRYSHLCLLDTDSGEVLEQQSRIPTTRKAFERRFSGWQAMRVAIETGTHSPWVSRLLKGAGHEVLVANARKEGQAHLRRGAKDGRDRRPEASSPGPARPGAALADRAPWRGLPSAPNAAALARCPGGHQDKAG